MKFEYIFSGPNYLRLLPSLDVMNHRRYNATSELISKGIQMIQEATNQDGKFPLQLSVLYNAFTEKRIGSWIANNTKFGFKNLYADSGGLQIITRGKTADDEIRQDVYKSQAISDYAMCFDEIPCINLSINQDVLSGERVRGGTVYVPAMAKDCARKTAHNIIEQIEYLTKMGSDTKVFYIIQGNTIRDMIEWFGEGVHELEKWHWDHIGGFAMAGTCMGPGSMEGIDTIVAYHLINKEFGSTYTKNHIHFLGYGCVRRLLPILYLRNSNFLDFSTHISFDSTTISMGYVRGIIMDTNGKIVRNQSIRTKQIINDAVEFFYPLFHEYFPNLSDGNIHSAIFKNYMEPSKFSIDRLGGEMAMVVIASRALIPCKSTLGFSSLLRSCQDNMAFDRSPLGLLQHIGDIEQYEEWYNLYSHKIPSNRIPRERSNMVNQLLS